ncbi:hypothetical protein NSA19_09880 [Actinomyces bowdenii]|uniref:hypothetical protein n=1 Tax=Actinomyces bowdenii TaxID=131109 RepID=UPI00214AD5F6|nr:hypothetical protein [Actinomyces bowdenii]MCR2053142.1 hypothetical protein [Actinomyces bowdenii]
MLNLSSDFQIHVHNDHQWRLIDTSSLHQRLVDPITAAIITILIGGPQRRSEIVEALTSESLPAQVILKRIEILLDKGIISTKPYDDLIEEWDGYGWREAYEYLKPTWDYPFEDYSKNGQASDRNRMLEYEAVEPDTVRYLAPKGPIAFSLPTIDQALEFFDSGSHHSAPIDERILNTASIATLPLEWVPSRTSGSRHMKRASPSGGARHPSEVYLLALHTSEIPPGVYQICIQTEAAHFINSLPTEADLRRSLPGAFRLPVRPAAIFVITSHFYRNMYRYREPRTFRTIYYDAGHLGGLIEAVTDYGNTISHGHQGFSDKFLGDLLHCGSLAQESPSYLVAVGERTTTPSTTIIGKSELAQ